MASSVTPDIEILVGLQGGFSINAGSGKLIRNQIEGIIRQTQTQINFQINIDATYLQKQITDAIKNMPPVKIPTSNGQSGGGKGGGSGASSEIQKIASLISRINQNKSKLLDLSSTTEQAKELRRQITALWSDVGQRVRDYATSTNQSQQDIMKMVAAQASVGKSADAWNLKVAKVHDTYNSLIKKITELNKTSRTTLPLQVSSLPGEALNTPEYNDFLSVLSEFQNKSRNVLGGKFNKLDAKDQIQQLKEIIALYSKVEEALKKVNKTQNTSLSMQKVSNRAYEFYEKIKDTAPKEFSDQVAKFFNDTRLGKYAGSARDAALELENLKNQAYKCGYAQETLGEKITRVFKEKLGYGVMAAAAMKARQAIQQLYTNVVELDTAMTELKKVTNETDNTYQKFLNNAANRAKSIGATLSDTVNATADFARLGYSLDESAQLADSALVYKNVGDGIADINDASESVISTMKAFNIEATNSMTIVDKFNEVGNNFAISSKGVGDALLNSASALAAANNDLDQSIALITAANSVVQDPEKVGTALKTVSMYLRAAKTEAEDAGESTDGMASSVSELRKQLLSLTGNKVDIQIDSKTFKSTYDIMKELSQVWGQLSDISQANILELIGGKRNSNVVSALLSNFQIAEEALKTSQEAAGSALAENEKYLDSINGKISKLSASYQDLSSRILDSSIIKMFLDFGIVITDFFNNIDKATNGAASSMLTFAAVATSVGIAVQTLNKLFTFAGVTKWAKDIVAGLSLLNGAVKGGSISAIIQALSTMPGLALAASAAIAGIAYSVYQWYQKSHPSLQQIQDDYKELTDKSESLSDQLKENGDRIAEINELKADGTATLEDEQELKFLQEENIELKAQISAYDELAKVKKEALSQGAVQRAEDWLAVGRESVRGHSGYANGKGNGKTVLDNAIAEYQNAKSQFEQAVKNRDADDMSKFSAQMESAWNTISEKRSEIKSIREDLDIEDPEQIGIIKTLDALIDRIDLLSGDPEVKNGVLQNILGRDYNTGAVDILKEYANSGNLTAESLASLRGSNASVDELITSIEEAGYDVSNLTGLIQLFKDEVNEEIPAASFDDVIDKVSALTEKYQLLVEAKKQVSEHGAVEMQTLENIASKYGDAGKEQVSLYVAGVISAKEMFSNLKDLYDNDVDAYQDELADKMASSPTFYKNLTSTQKQLVNELGKSYGIDYDNFKTVESLKIEYQARAIRKLASNYSKYTGATISELKIALHGIESRLQYDDVNLSPAGFASLTKEANALRSTISDITEMQKALDQLVVDGVGDFNPSKYIDQKSSSSSSTDKYKQAIEKDIKILQHQRDMDLITEEEYYNKLEEIEKRYFIDREKYKEEIWDLDQQIFNGRREILSDWISDQERIADNFNLIGDVNSQQKVYDEILKKTIEMIDKAYKYGLDENSDYVQELYDQYEKTCGNIFDLTTGQYDDFINYADTFDMWDSFDFSKLDALEGELKAITAQYKAGYIAMSDYIDKYNEVAEDIYKIRKDSIETIIDLTMQMIEQEVDDEVDALDKQIDKIGEIIDLKKKLLQDTNDEADHEKQVAEAVEEIAKLQSKISQLKLDDSRDAYAQRVELESQLAEKQKDLADLQNDYALDKTLDVLDETKDAKEDAINDEKEALEKSIDSWAKKYKLAIDRIDNDWDGLYDDLNDWMVEHRSSIDGPDSLRTAWENVDAMVRQTGMDIESLYNSNGSIGINPSDSTVSSNITRASEIKDQMQANSIQAKISKSVMYNGKNLHKENITLAAEYEKLTGQKLHYDSVLGWCTENGKPLYYLPKYHTGGLVTGGGGIVDGTGSISDTDVLAILKRGELVLNDGQKKSLRSVISTMMSVATVFDNVKSLFSYTSFGRANSDSVTLAPQMAITINHNGTMTDADADRYGKRIGNTALETLYQTMRTRGIKG